MKPRLAGCLTDVLRIQQPRRRRPLAGGQHAELSGSPRDRDQFRASWEALTASAEEERLSGAHLKQNSTTCDLAETKTLE